MGEQKIDSTTPTSILVQIIARHEAQCMMASYGLAGVPTPDEVTRAAAAIEEINRRSA